MAQPPWTRTTCFRRLVHVTRCASTQDLALAPDEPGCAVFWADHQTAGRGRQGRTWDDAEGEDLAVTFRVDGVVPRPERLPASVSLAVLGVVERVLGRPLRLKWPNDVYVDGHKLAGVLVDSTNQPPRFAIGVGLNVNRTRFPAELAEHATSLALLAGRTFDRSELLAALAHAIDRVLAALRSDDVGDLHATYADRIALRDQDVELTWNSIATRGRVARVDLDEITLEDGRTLPLAGLQGLRRV